MWIQLHQVGKRGSLIDLSGSSVSTKIDDLQLFIRRPHDAYAIKFESESEILNFFQAVLTAIKDKVELLDTVEAGLKFTSFDQTAHPIRIIGPDGHDHLSVHVENTPLRVHEC